MIPCTREETATRTNAPQVFTVDLGEIAVTHDRNTSLVAHSLGGGIRQQNADEKRPLPRLPGRDQMLSFSIRFMASAILASGAVTDSRK